MSHYIPPFALDIANEQTAFQDHCRLRYRVYVEEIGLRVPAGAPPETETDALDAYAYPINIRHQPTNVLAGCARLIVARHLPPGEWLPVLRHLQPDGLAQYDHAVAGELSRVIVARDFRWGSSVSGTASIPVLFLLKLAALALSTQLRIEQVYSQSDPRMVRLARRIGVRMAQVGPAYEMYGPRAPFLMQRSEAFHSVPAVWRDTLQGMAPWAAAAVGIHSRTAA